MTLGTLGTRTAIHAKRLAPAVLAAAFLWPGLLGAQWAAGAGETVRDAFGPRSSRGGATVCRGACGSGCPSTCDRAETYECLGEGRLRRVRTYVCGTHAGCREHDDCLDRCLRDQAAGFDCQATCHSEAVDRFGFETATAWAAGRGPFDGEPITFEYTLDAPEDARPTFRCPDGTELRCAEGLGTCTAQSGAATAPVFASYEGVAGSMRISGLRTGTLCGNEVCRQTTEIEVVGGDTCDGEPCTRYGVEFDYENADPAAPLECSTSTSGGDGDFIGGLIKRGFDSAPDLGADTFAGNSGLGELLGALQKVVQSADSPEDLEVSIAPLGPDGKPIESRRVGSRAQGRATPVPASVDLPAASGHLVVPMYELADATGEAKVKQIRCTHKGQPVFEATFSLRE